MARLEVETWREVAFYAVRAFIIDRGGAVVWPQVEAALVFGTWAAQNAALWCDGVLPEHVASTLGRIDAHHVTYARRQLLDLGELESDVATLQRRRVTAWVHVPTRDDLRHTEVQRLAASRRRAYRRFLKWSQTSETCGDIAERRVAATLSHLAGDQIWLDKSKRGEVSHLDGRPVPGGPLDHAGHWAIDPDTPAGGFVPFAVEVKNVASVIYPRDKETWDLLAKVGAFPDRVPILITRQPHHWTFRMFMALGAIAYRTDRQWFSGTIDEDDFDTVTQTLGLHGAVRVADPDMWHRGTRNFFEKVLRKPVDGFPSLMQRSQARWAVAAPICAKYIDLREDLAQSERSELFAEFIEDLNEADIDTSEFSQLD